MGKFKDTQVRGKLKPGLHCDGEGLYLNVSASGSRSWLFRGTVKGRRTPTGTPYRVEVGLGSLADVGLADAREKAAVYRKQCRAGVNPLDEKRREKITFEVAARTVHTNLLPTWSNAHFARSWLASLEADVFPKLGARKIQSVGTADVLAVLLPIWTAKNDTAKKIKQRVAAVFDWAKGAGHYQGENPVAGLTKALPMVRVKANHYDAMPWQDVPAFLVALADREGTSARCLEFIIHTAVRSGEARGARWAEIDVAEGIWSLPPERMKARRPHRVPLSAEALAVLEKVRGLDADLVFPSAQRDKTGNAKVMSDMAFKALFLRMKVEGITTHGFRSTFRDWCSESARADFELAEAALAHAVGTTTARAYARSDLFDRRRALMEAWSQYLTGQSGKIVQMVRA